MGHHGRPGSGLGACVDAQSSKPDLRIFIDGMIARLRGKLVEKGEHRVLLEVQGVCYEIWMPVSVLARVDQNLDEQGLLLLVTYHYLQVTPSSALPVIVGFLNDLERDFFEQDHLSSD